jgi:YggT family protein
VRAVGVVIHTVLWVFIALLWVRFVFDWVQAFARSWTPRGPLLVVLEVVYSMTDPPIRALRRVIPPIRLGGVALDLSLLLVLLGAYLLLVLNSGVFLEG